LRQRSRLEKAFRGAATSILEGYSFGASDASLAEKDRKAVEGLSLKSNGSRFSSFVGTGADATDGIEAEEIWRS